tara:strand:- start:2090 stop:2860 length:771 start_codon:yes stop_codon:yes gene_type:complete
MKKTLSKSRSMSKHMSKHKKRHMPKHKKSKSKSMSKHKKKQMSKSLTKYNKKYRKKRTKKRTNKATKKKKRGGEGLSIGAIAGLGAAGTFLLGTGYLLRSKSSDNIGDDHSQPSSRPIKSESNNYIFMVNGKVTEFSINDPKKDLQEKGVYSDIKGRMSSDKLNYNQVFEFIDNYCKANNIDPNNIKMRVPTDDTDAIKMYGKDNYIYFDYNNIKNTIKNKENIVVAINSKSNITYIAIKTPISTHSDVLEKSIEV